MNMFDLEYQVFASHSSGAVFARNGRGRVGDEERAERRAAMQRAKEEAMRSGHVVKVGESVEAQPVEEPVNMKHRKFINKLFFETTEREMTGQEFIGICNLYKQSKADDDEYTWRDAVTDYCIPF